MTIKPAHKTVVHMLVDAAKKGPNQEALVCGDERLDYAGYLSAVTGFSRELINHDLRGTRIAMLMRNSLDYCIAMFAIQMAGAQIVPLNPRYTKNELLELLEDAAVSALIFDEDNRDRDIAIAKELGIPHPISVGPSHRLTQYIGDHELPTLPIGEGLAELLYTGGTTGRSKGVEIDHRTVMTNLAQREALVPARADLERLLCVMPLYHCYAISMCLHNMVSYRGALVIVEPYSPQTVLETISSERITLFGGSPTLFAGLIASDGFNDADFSNLHITYSGSAPLSKTLLKRWEEATGSILIEGYGQTEAGPVVSFNPVIGVRKQGSVGIVLPDTDLEIVDVSNGKEILTANNCGEIRLRGPQVMKGYRNRPEETASAVRNGWLYTGDIGELDEDGYLYIRGRKKEMIIVSGFNVYPGEVEQVIALHPSVGECAVVGTEDAKRGEIPVAYIVARDKSLCSEIELVGHCEEHLARYKVPRVINIVDAIPKTSVGKIDKLTLKQQAKSNNYAT